MSSRLDEIFSGDISNISDTSTALFNHADKIREAIVNSIENNGIHNTAEHWGEVEALVGKTNSEEIKLLFNDTIAEVF